jgi:SPP1 family predicted phage head-tail adaptor
MQKRITIQDEALTADGMGGHVKTWTNSATVWARIDPASGSDRLQAMQLQSPHMFKITIRQREVSTKQRIAYGSRTFNIRSVTNVSERDRRTEIMAEENVAT